MLVYLQGRLFQIIKPGLQISFRYENLHLQNDKCMPNKDMLAGIIACIYIRVEKVTRFTAGMYVN